MKLKSLILLALVGCDEEASHHHHTGESEIAIGCDHFAYGEDQPRTATPDAPDAQSTIAAVHQRFVVALPCIHVRAGVVPVETCTQGDRAGDNQAIDPLSEDMNTPFFATKDDYRRGTNLAFVANEAGDFYFMLGEDLPFAVEQDGTTLTPAQVVVPGDECAAAARVYQHTLEAGTYTLVIGPTEATELTLVPHLAGQDHSH